MGIFEELISANTMSDAEVKNNVAAEAPTAEELKAKKRSAEDDDVDVKKQKTENGKHDEENGEDEEDGEEEEDIDGEEEEDLDGEGEDDLDEEDGEEGEEEEGEGEEDFRVYQWMIKHGGIPTEASYGPYLGQDSYCNLNKSTMGLKIKGWVNVTSGDLDGLKVAIAAHGPVSVAIDASHKSLGFYSNGVYYEEDCNNDIDGLDHAVLAVGYGEILGQKYWLVKNSWSTYWGNDGYVLMSQKDNNCGVATAATYVIPDMSTMP